MVAINEEFLIVRPRRGKLPPEELDRRKRARWKRQAALRRMSDGEFRNQNPHVRKTTVGVPDRPIQLIRDVTMDIRYREFWMKRGYDTPPSCTMAGIVPSASDYSEEIGLIQMRGAEVILGEAEESVGTP